MEKKVEPVITLIVKRDITDVSRLKELIEDSCRIEETDSSVHVIDALYAEHDSIAAVYIEDSMLEKVGYTILEEMNKQKWTYEIPVVIFSTDATAHCPEHAYELGAIDYFCLNKMDSVGKNRVGNSVRLAIRQREMLREQMQSFERQSEQAKFRDALTGQLNMDGFRYTALDILRQHPERQYIIWYMDIRNFKFVNASFGYEVGNRLLKFLCDKIKIRMKEGEILCRIVGDNLAGLTRLAEDTIDDGFFSAVTEEVKSYFSEIDKHFQIEICSGAYLICREDYEDLDVDRMLGYARVAQQNIKKTQKGGMGLYNKENWMDMQRRLDISAHLEQAIENGEISVWYQPQWDYDAGKMIGAEALCRWKHEKLGWISPGEFISVLEQAGQINRLDRYVWEVVCRTVKKWKESGHAIPVSVNISRKDIIAGDVYEQIQELLKKYDLTPESIHLEITETAYVEESKKILDLVHKLKSAGFTVEMDDFGSGFSSLNMLKDLPVDVLKMDLRFLDESQHGVKSGKIISAIIRMAHAMNMLVIAEGVETNQQADFLKNLGCSYMQGFYFSKPLPEEQFEEEWLKAELGAVQKRLDGERMFQFHELLDARSNSSFIFNQCMGAASLLEYDGNSLQFLLINDAFYRLIGGKEVILKYYNNDALETVSEEARGEIVKAIDRATEDIPSTAEFVLAVTNRMVRASFRRVFRNKNMVALFCELEDITREQILSKQVNELQEEMKLHLSLIPGGTFRYEADGLQRFEYVSASMISMLGYQDEMSFREKFNNNFPDMVYEKDRDRVQGEIQKQIEKGTVTYVEYRIEKADGSLLWVYDSGSLAVDEKGKRWFYVVLADINDLKKIRLKERWQHEKLELLMSAPGTITYEYDPENDRMTLSYNTENGELCERTADHYLEILPETNWVAEESLKTYMAAIQDTLEKPCNRSFNAKVAVKGGGYCWAHYTFVSVADDNGRVYRVVGRAEQVQGL